MACQQLTADDARQSLAGHLEIKGQEIHARFGPHLGWNNLQELLQDRNYVRYPCDIVFDAGPLEPGEFAHPEPKGERPEAGFNLHVHPFFMTQLERVPYLVLYQLVIVNYGDFATPEDAEAFGAAALGLSPDEYYHEICELADQLG